MENEFTLPAFPSFGIRRCSLFFLSFGIALLFLIPASASATTWTVTGTSDSATATACTTPGGCSTLRSAVLAAQNGDTIDLTGLTGKIELTSALPAISVSMNIEGPGANVLAIDGAGSYQIFQINAAPVTISGLTLTDGYSATYGGAIDSYLSDPNDRLNVYSCAFMGNYAGDQGGAIFDYGGVVTVANSTFSGNLIDFNGIGGGAISVKGYSIKTLEPSSLAVVNSTFYGNKAPNGGAILQTGSALLTGTIINSTFVGNSAFSGGSTYLTGSGGAIYPAAGPATIENSIFTGNTSASNGAVYPNVSTEDHNLFFNNTGGNGISTLGANDVTTDPKLLPLGYYGGSTENMMPEVNSAAICVGDATDLTNALTAAQSNDSNVSTTQDQRGFPISPTYGACDTGNVDIGAVQTNYLLVTSTDDSGTGTLRSAISTANGQSYADIGFSTSLGSGNPTITLTGTTAPLLSQGDTVIVGPPDAVTISGGGSVQILHILNQSTLVTLYGLTVTGGHDFDGAVDNFGNLSVRNCTFSDNHSDGGNGGAIQNNGTLLVTNSTFSNNSALNGGAIETVNDPLTITNSTFSGNQATGGSADDLGGVIYDSGSGTVSATNDIFSGNSATSGSVFSSAGGAFAESHNLFNGNSPTASFSGTGDVTGDPKLASLDNYGGPTKTLLPLPGSTAICAGNPAQSNLPRTDQRGFSRLNTSYNGFSASTPCLDIGAVQTDYTSIQFVSPPTDGYTATASVAIGSTGAPIVSVTENGQNIGGVPVTLALSPTPSPAATGAIATTVAGTGATFSGLTVATPGTYTLSSALDITSGVSISTSSAPTLTVTPPIATSTSLSYSPGSPVYGDTVTFTATVTPDSGTAVPEGTVSFTIDSGTPVDGTAEICPTGTASYSLCAYYSTGSLDAGSHTVTASFTAGAGYSDSATASATNFTIAKATPTSVTITNIPTTTVVEGGSFKPTVSVDPASDTGTTSVSSGSTSVCTVSGTAPNQLVSFVAAGTCELTASVAATTDYTQLTGSQQSFTIETLDAAAQTYVQNLYTGGVLTSGQYNSLEKELVKAAQMASRGKFNGAIANLEDFISEVNDLYNSGILTQEQANTLIGYAQAQISRYEQGLL